MKLYEFIWNLWRTYTTSMPPYNKQSRQYLLGQVPDMEKNAQKYGVKILHQFHSGLEHTFLWVVDADNAGLIEDLMARTAGRFNTIKIVPLVTFQGLIERCKQIEEGTFFPDAAG
jgi:hypothetical protein